MKKIFIWSALIVLLFSLNGCHFIRQRFSDTYEDLKSYNISAKQWFPYVTEKAQTWQTDALFYGIPETQVNLKGEGEKWSYLFYSRENSRQIIVQINHGFISLKKNTMNVLPSIKNWEIDSVGAALAAEKHGAKEFVDKNPKARLVVSLFGKIPGTKKKRAIWILKYYGTSSVFVMGIDANTGGKVSLPAKFY